MIDRSHEINENADLIGEFRRRFPLFENIMGQFGEDLPSERIPWFFAYILAAAANPGAGACCIVLEKTPGTAAIAASSQGLCGSNRIFPASSNGMPEPHLSAGSVSRSDPATLYTSMRASGRTTRICLD